MARGVEHLKADSGKLQTSAERVKGQVGPEQQGLKIVPDLPKAEQRIPGLQMLGRVHAGGLKGGHGDHRSPLLQNAAQAHMFRVGVGAHHRRDSKSPGLQQQERVPVIAPGAAPVQQHHPGLVQLIQGDIGLFPVQIPGPPGNQIQVHRSNTCVSK